MKKSAFSILLLLAVYCSYAQVPADSLTGTYAGQYWYANPATNPWVITNDTTYVTNVDTINCKASVNGAILGMPTMYTTYYSCNSSIPSNGYTLFFYDDSLKMIYDNVPQSPPNPPISFRFYGKRISSQISGIYELVDNTQLQIYPNPCYGLLNIECKILSEETLITITDILGMEINKLKVQKEEKIQVDVSYLKKGIYFLQFKTAKATLTKKIIVN